MSMITYRRTSLLDSPAQTLVNTVNCVGVMGKGLAKEFRSRDPLMYERYRKVCETGNLKPGKLWLWRGPDNWVLNFPTKVHWRQPSRIEWVEAGLQKFVEMYEHLDIKEISFPRLGCGNGNLDWEDVRPLMEGYLSRVRIPVYIHDYSRDIGIPEHLEEIASRAGRLLNYGGLSFSEFLDGLSAVGRIGGSYLVNLEDQIEFAAEMRLDNALVIRDAKTTHTFDMEDLHAAWVSLLRGLVTKDRIEWASGDGGDYVITMMALLPHARPIEIERNGHKEIAVELVPSARHAALAGRATEQLKLEWH